MSVLLVSYFFPPAGGAGVQRPLKFAAHLSELDIETHVLAPTDPKWIHEDRDLAVPAAARVHRVPYLGPRTRLLAEELYGRSRTSRVLSTLESLGPRLLLPDQHVPWVATAGPAAVALVRRAKIDVVLTTSPPGSVHLIGALVKAATGARWVADLRDPLFEHPHSRLERRSVRMKESTQSALAGLIGREADAIVAASEVGAEQIGERTGRVVETIRNGCDYEDFDGLEYHPAKRLRMTHVGLFIGNRTPRPFLGALARSPVDAVARFVGGFRSADLEWARRAGIADRIEVIPYLPHRRALALERDSEALLLLIPDAQGRGNGILSAKLFEYIAADRPILAVVPPGGEAAALLRKTGRALIVPPDDVAAIGTAIETLVARHERGELDVPPLDSELRKRLSRGARAAELAGLLRSLD